MAFFCLSFFTNIRTGARTRAMVLTMVYKKVSKLRNVGDKCIGEVCQLKHIAILIYGRSLRSQWFGTIDLRRGG